MDNKGPYHSVRIESDPDSVLVQHVFIDGEELHGIESVQLFLSPESVPRIYI